MKNINVVCLMLVAAVLSCSQLYGQLSPFGAMYYSNQYINNPAHAGTSNGLVVDAGLRVQDSNLPGAPKTQFLTGSYALNDKAGIGLNLNSEQVGLIRKIRTVASFAYHLPLSSSYNKISFGLSLGLTDQLIDYSLMDGSQNDISLGNFNQRQTYADGDFGIKYTGKGLNVEAALLNISDYLRDNKQVNGVANVAKYYLAGSYKFQLSQYGESFSVEPKIAYRVVKGNKDILDFGTNVGVVDNKLNFFGIYHSSQNATLGLGASLLENLAMNFMYTSATAVLANESTGSFEINLKLKLLNKR